MIIHDISRDALTTPVYEGDPETQVTQLKSIDELDEYNLSAISMSVHCGTHIDAPLHFYEEGSSIDNLRLNTFYGKCTVISVEGILTGEDMESFCRTAAAGSFSTAMATHFFLTRRQSCLRKAESPLWEQMRNQLRRRLTRQSPTASLPAQE